MVRSLLKAGVDHQLKPRAPLLSKRLLAILLACTFGVFAFSLWRFLPHFPQRATTPAPAAFVIYTVGVTNSGDGYPLESWPFDDLEVEKRKEYLPFTTSFLTALSPPPWGSLPVRDLVIFRLKDEVIVDGRRHVNVTSDRNPGVLVIPKSIIAEFGNTHLAFTEAKNSIEQIRSPSLGFAPPPGSFEPPHRMTHGLGIFMAIDGNMGAAHAKVGDFATVLIKMRNLDSPNDALIVTNLVLSFQRSNGFVLSSNLLISPVTLNSFGDSFTLSNKFPLFQNDRPVLRLCAVAGGKDLHDGDGGTSTNRPQSFLVTFPAEIHVE